MNAVAIDGPAGAGKSTIARAAAKEIGFIYVDTGALYRAIGLYMLQNKVDTGSEQAVSAELDGLEVSLGFAEGEQHVFLCGKDVSGLIRTPDVSMAASKVSAMPRVREFLFSLQKDMAKKHDVIMDGRDIGTVVLPDARLKIFLTASPEERARRRCKEMLEKGMKADFEEGLADIKTRDYNDSHRAIAPLAPAEDAVLVDTTGDTLEESTARLLKIIRDRLAL